MSSILDVKGVQISNVDEYEKKCDLVKKLIKTTYKNSQITFNQLNKNDLMYVIIDNIVKIAIMPALTKHIILNVRDTNWIEIKNNIDTKLKQTLGQRMCEGCNGQIKCLASCNNCNTNTCLECYIDSFRTGKGIIKCKFCSYLFGHQVPDEYIDLAIDNIRTNANF